MQHSDHGAAVQIFKIYMAHRSPFGSDPFSLASSAGPSLASTVLTGLLNGDEYRFKITAVNVIMVISCQLFLPSHQMQLGMCTLLDPLCNCKSFRMIADFEHGENLFMVFEQRCP